MIFISFLKKKNKIFAYNCLRVKKISKYNFLLLDTIIVDKKLERNGYGGYLLEINKIISLLKKKPIFLKANKITGSFYNKFDFNLIMKKKNFLYFDFNNNRKSLQKLFTLYN